jgi:hypothetical protein
VKVEREELRDPVTVAEFRITPFDPPLGTHLPERLDWLVVAMRDEDMPDRKGTEVHRFRH